MGLYKYISICIYIYMDGYIYIIICIHIGKYHFFNIYIYIRKAPGCVWKPQDWIPRICGITPEVGDVFF